MIYGSIHSLLVWLISGTVYLMLLSRHLLLIHLKTDLIGSGVIKMLNMQGWARGSFVKAEAEVEAERSRQRRGKAAMFLTEARKGRGRGRELEAEARQTKLAPRPRRGRAKSMLFVSF